MRSFFMGEGLIQRGRMTDALGGTTDFMEGELSLQTRREVDSMDDE